MAKKIFPSSYVCDCGHELDFFEKTIWEIQRMSARKKVHLGDADHIIVFYRGEAIEILCPKLNRCAITETEY